MLESWGQIEVKCPYASKQIFTKFHLCSFDLPELPNSECNFPRFLLQAKREEKHLQGMIESALELKSVFASTSLPLTDVDESCLWWVTDLKGGSTLPHYF